MAKKRDIKKEPGPVADSILKLCRSKNPKLIFSRTVFTMFFAPLEKTYKH